MFLTLIKYAGIYFIMGFIGSLLPGTVLWVTYPFIHYVFPNAYANGYISYKLSWIVCVFLIWGINSILNVFRNENKTIIFDKSLKDKTFENITKISNHEN